MRRRRWAWPPDAQLAEHLRDAEARCDLLEVLLAREQVKVRSLTGACAASARARAEALQTTLDQAGYELAQLRLERDRRARARTERHLTPVPADPPSPDTPAPIRPGGLGHEAHR